MAQRKATRVHIPKGVKEGSARYVWEDLRDPPKGDVLRYRQKKVDGHIVKVAVLKKDGPRGGRTVVTAIGHPVGERKSHSKRVEEALRRAREMARQSKSRKGGKR